jgi:hypothetical protein
MRLRPGTAPDSWGGWFADAAEGPDAAQLPWSVFLDEAAAAGYEWIELRPYGCLPTDEPARLDVDLFAIVEQDLSPCPPDTPLSIATRTARCLGGRGLGPVRIPARAT